MPTSRSAVVQLYGARVEMVMCLVYACHEVLNDSGSRKSDCGIILLGTPLCMLFIGVNRISQISCETYSHIIFHHRKIGNEIIICVQIMKAVVTI